MQVIDADWLTPHASPFHPFRRWLTPPLTPPPANQAVKAWGLWSRPGFCSSCDRETAEFAAADDQRSVEQAAGFQIGQQAGDRYVSFAGKPAMVAGDIDVTIPATLVLHCRPSRSARIVRRVPPAAAPSGTVSRK